MAFWIEIHCDVRASGPPDSGRLAPFCHSNRTAVPDALVDDLAAGKRDVVREARKRGWVLSREYGWQCPACKPTVEMLRRALKLAQRPDKAGEACLLVAQALGTRPSNTVRDALEDLDTSLRKASPQREG